MEHQQATKANQSSQGEAQLSARPAASDYASIHPLLEFQLALGNRTCGRFIQAKLKVSQPGDALEQEADRVADRVMRMPDTADIESSMTPGVPVDISRNSAPDLGDIARQEADEREPAVQPEGVIGEDELLSLKRAPGTSPQTSAGLSAGIQSLSGGETVPTGLRSFFEPRFGYDFSHVRFHTDSRAAETARQLNARAYTIGADVAFAQGEYQPETPEGRRLLAHELTHVVQQSGQVGTVMRACDCSAFGASKPTAEQEAALKAPFPRLGKGDWCVTAPATPTYNCFAWSVGDTSKWIDKEVDTAYGDNNGTLEFSDFDKFYKAKGGLKPVSGKTPKDAKVALFGLGGKPTHAARVVNNPCGNFESKLGKYVRIAHSVLDLEGGPVYGDVDRFYV